QVVWATTLRARRSQSVERLERLGGRTPFFERPFQPSLEPLELLAELVRATHAVGPSVQGRVLELAHDRLDTALHLLNLCLEIGNAPLGRSKLSTLVSSGFLASSGLLLLLNAAQGFLLSSANRGRVVAFGRHHLPLAKVAIERSDVTLV